MSDVIRGFIEDGVVKKYDYESLANKPDLDAKIERDALINGVNQGNNKNYAIFDCAKSWLKHNGNLYYGTSGNPNSFNRVDGVNTLVTATKEGTVQDNRYPLDCMSFIQMCLMGIGFEESIFGDGSNAPKYPRAAINFLSDAYCKMVTIYSDGTVTDFNDNYTFERVTTWQFAEFCRSIGIYNRIEATYDADSSPFGKLQVGDILFFGDKTNDLYKNRFDGIYHCAIYAGSTRYGMPMVFDCSNAEANTRPVLCRVVPRNSSIVGYTRIPLGDEYNIKKENIAFVGKEKIRNPFAMLQTTISDNDIYEVRAKVTMLETAAINHAMPAVTIDGYQYCRFDTENVPLFEVGKPKEIVMYVGVAPLLRGSNISDGVDYLRMQFIGVDGYSISANTGTIEILSVVPILCQNDDYDVGYAHLPEFTYTNLDDLAKQIGTYIDDRTALRCITKFKYNTNGTWYFGYHMRTYSSRWHTVMITGYSTGRHVECTGDPDNLTVTTFSANSPCPWYLADLAI